MSNSSNLGKELKRLRKEVDELKNRRKGFHFLVLSEGETEEEKLKQMIDAGKMAVGDEYQVIEVPWSISQLKGSPFIPEGNSADPLADPGLPPPAPQAIASSWGEKRDREQRWKDHIRKIESDDQRYDPDKPKSGWR